MPSSRHDPFTDAPLRPTTSNTTSLTANPQLRTQTSQQSLRSNTSNTSAAAARTRQARDPFAPSLARRGTTPRYEDEVLADSDSEHDLTSSTTTAQRQKQQQARRIRHGSPDVKYGRGGGKGKQVEGGEDFVNRKPDGSYLLGVAGLGETVSVPQMSLVKSEEEREQDEVDAHYVAISRQFFTSGASLGGGKTNNKKHEEDLLEQLRLPMMMRMREKVMQELEDERWKYEAASPVASSAP